MYSVAKEPKKGKKRPLHFYKKDVRQKKERAKKVPAEKEQRLT